MKTRKSLVLRLMDHEQKCIFTTPIASPEVVLGLLSCLTLPENAKLSIVVNLEEIPVPEDVRQQES